MLSCCLIFKNPLHVTLVPKGVTVNDDIGEDSDDYNDDKEDNVGDFCLHNGRDELYNTFFDIDFLETNQIDVGTSRMKFPVYRNVEPVTVESGMVQVNWQKVLVNWWKVVVNCQKMLINRLTPCCC